MTTTIALSAAALGPVHAYLDGGGEDLTAIVAETRAAKAKGPVVWSGTLTPETIHGIGAIHALAKEEGVAAKLAHSGLNERQIAFYEDYYIHGPSVARPSSLTGSAFFAAIWEAIHAALQMLRRARPETLAPGGKAIIIGAYGGDHVGDTAILGGVLLHLARHFGTTEAEVLSHRPEHTSRLIDGLASPVSVRVFDYTPETIAERVPDAGMLVIAGGPMMDFPRVLAKHIGAIHLARSKGIPLRIERVGVGPFKQRLSRWAARHVFRLASSISLRSSGDGRDPVLKGLDYSVGRDPAFDYLATRSFLDRKTSSSASADRLLAATNGHMLVGINIRPIRHELAAEGQSYSRAVDSEFFHRLADAMIRSATESTRPLTYVFFPMNPIEFGKSDLAAAYRLHKLVAGRVDFRVWEADPDIDDVLGLLRRLDAVVAMRFHAAIFALSQGKPTFGIDYCPSLKVEQLFADLGKSEDAVRIDHFVSNWLVNKLVTLAGVPEAMELET